MIGTILNYTKLEKNIWPNWRKHCSNKLAGNIIRNMKEVKEHKSKILTIYFTKDKKSRQVIRPTEQFSGDWVGLVQAIAGNNYDTYEVK